MGVLTQDLHRPGLGLVTLEDKVKEQPPTRFSKASLASSHPTQFAQNGWMGLTGVTREMNRTRNWL